MPFFNPDKRTTASPFYPGPNRQHASDVRLPTPVLVERLLSEAAMRHSPARNGNLQRR